MPSAEGAQIGQSKLAVYMGELQIMIETDVLLLNYTGVKHFEQCLTLASIYFN